MAQPPTVKPGTVPAPLDNYNLGEARTGRTMGPAMFKLTPKQRVFVEQIARDPFGRAGVAYAKAYPDHANPQAAASTLLRHPVVIEAIKEEAEAVIRSMALKAAGVLNDIMDDPSHKDRFKASVRALQHAGLDVTQKIEVRKIVENRSPAEILESIKALNQALGLNAVAVEQIEIVAGQETVEDAMIESDTTGLEDLL